MASSFIGLPVSISLRSGLTLQGTVQSVNAVQGTIVLSSSHLFQPGQDPTIEQGEYLGTRAVGRTEVVGLEVVSVSKGEQQQPSYTSQPSPSYPSPHSPLYTSLEGGDDLSSSPGPRSNRQGGRRGGGRKVKGKGYQGGDAGETGNEADLSTAAWEEGRGSRGDGTRRRNPPSQSQSQSSYGHQQQQQSHHSQQQHHSPSHHQSHSQQQQQSFSEEFDFGAGLRSFNKKAVFEEIRAQDLTDPSLLLVSHNRSSPHPHANNPKMVKMRPNESVLSRREVEGARQRRVPSRKRRRRGCILLLKRRRESGAQAREKDGSQLEDMLPLWSFQRGSGVRC
ncbi:hypothetical protein BCR35DRAFT_179045 [Leucosporidium creatinivorum]|uniref:FDF domain-containing protein n=1 Tax=Leucosporidium creatinivorum TaxID=106004 RepID=A0A1Y2E8S5_9BASI|nr:hypothetical protein BCR35DRAFT_179045 [Leucosporidium creatinivorum]